MMGNWPTRAGASGSLHSDGRKKIIRCWARAIHETYPDIKGIVYPSSMNSGNPALVLWERAKDSLPVPPVMNDLLREDSIAYSLRNIANELEYDFREPTDVHIGSRES